MIEYKPKPFTQHIPQKIRDKVFPFLATYISKTVADNNFYVDQELSDELHEFITSRGIKNFIIIDLSYEWAGHWNLGAFDKYFDMLEEHIGMKIYVTTLNHKICSRDRYIYYNQFWFLCYYNRANRDDLTIPLDRQYSMLYQNGRTDIYKIHMINRLHANGLLDDAVWSAIKLRPNALEYHIPEDLQKQLPKTFDNQKASDWGDFLWMSYFEDLYKHTRFSLVAETQMHDKACRYSEKTVKAILNKHLFIICGYYKILELLRHDGFKTFDGYIDESYDNILDWKERQDAITKEVTKLVNMSDEDWLAFERSVQPIIDYNFNHLKTMEESMGNQLINYVNKLGEEYPSG